MSSVTSPPDTPTRTYLESPTAPALRLPEGACDSHVHVFGPAARYPFTAQRKITPLDAPREKLFALHAFLGISRCVIVQSIVHGLDNSVVEDAIRAGGGRYLGVALVQVDVSDLELRRLADAGFRAVRFNFMRHLAMGAQLDDIIALTHRLAHVDMHLQVHFESELIHTLAPGLVRSAVPVVIDHMGRVDARKGLDHPDFQALMQLLKTPHFHVKVSGIDRIDADALPDERYAAGVLLARTLVERFPEQCVWGTDWPHPNHTHIPDDGALVNALAQIAPDSLQLHRILCANPQQLYRFGPDNR
jgi:2-pyrone-4,6-dicarboxylate lactonase